MNLWEKIGIGIAVLVVLGFVAYNYSTKGIEGSSAMTPPPPGGPNMVYVGDEGDDGNDGSREMPVRTISQAFDLAANYQSVSINILGAKYGVTQRDLADTFNNPITSTIPVVILTSQDAKLYSTGSNDGKVATMYMSIDDGVLTMRDIDFQYIALQLTVNNNGEVWLRDNNFSSQRIPAPIVPLYNNVRLGGVANTNGKIHIRDNTFRIESDLSSLSAYPSKSVAMSISVSSNPQDEGAQANIFNNTIDFYPTQDKAKLSISRSLMGIEISTGGQAETTVSGNRFADKVFGTVPYSSVERQAMIGIKLHEVNGRQAHIYKNIFIDMPPGLDIVDQTPFNLGEGVLLEDNFR